MVYALFIQNEIKTCDLSKGIDFYGLKLFSRLWVLLQTMVFLAPDGIEYATKLNYLKTDVDICNYHTSQYSTRA